MKSVPSPRIPTPWLVVALIVILALPVSAGATPFDPGALLGKLRVLITSIWSDPVRESAPVRVSAPVGKPKTCPDAPGGVCPPVVGEYGCEIEPGGLCQH